MTLWRTRAFLGVSAAALLTAVAPFGTGAISERAALDRIGALRAALSRATPPPGAAEASGADETLAQDIASLVRRGLGAASAGTGEAPPSPAAAASTPAGARAARRWLRR